MDSALDSLEVDFRFKVEQRAALKSVVSGKHTLCLLPTGYGKSVCYTMAPLLMDRLEPTIVHTVLVISPLRSLMADQKATLEKKGFQVLLLQSAKDLDNAKKKGHYSIIMASPEAIKLWGQALVEALDSKLIAIALDEVHCLLKWGEDFRPSYREVKTLVSQYCGPFLLLTATLDQKLKDDLFTELSLSTSEVAQIEVLPNRPNIYLDVRHVTHGRGYKELDFLAEEIRDKGVDMPKAIIYCRSINAVSDIYLHFMALLRGAAYADHEERFEKRLLQPFHSEVKASLFNHVMAEFPKATSHIRIVVSTIGFGMGVDIPDVRQVFHWGCSKNAMSYWQEIGRAGRDGFHNKNINRFVWKPNDVRRYIFYPLCRVQT